MHQQIILVKISPGLLRERFLKDPVYDIFSLGKKLEGYFMTEHSEIRQSIDYLVARIARDYQKEEYKDSLKVQIPFGRRAEILLADDYLTPDEKIIFEDGIDPAIKSELFKEVLQAKTDKVFKSFLLEIFGKQPVLNENLSITTTKSGDKQYIIINFQGALPY